MRNLLLIITTLFAASVLVTPLSAKSTPARSVVVKKVQAMHKHSGHGAAGNTTLLAAVGAGAAALIVVAATSGTGGASSP
ncbi:MAG: hypothetical protein KGQ42_09435 [Alphaproteobacteria bacterium]|nr:hypothetical protein [Alphaproteobacteria bacterium]MDE2341581.1 hypothetical protein [Alphaproteobacteria bacterium]